MPKRTIHRFVHEIAQLLLKADKPNNHSEQETETVIGDSTEVRALNSREMNMVHALILTLTSSNSGQLLNLGVNDGWPRRKADTLISDNEPGLTNAVDAKNRQI